MRRGGARADEPPNADVVTALAALLAGG